MPKVRSAYKARHKRAFSFPPLHCAPAGKPPTTRDLYRRINSWPGALPGVIHAQGNAVWAVSISTTRSSPPPMSERVRSPNKWARPASARFWEKVDRSGECWEWQGAVGHTGHGVFRDRGKNLRAHRVSYEFENGPIPLGLFVCHHCDNPRCVRTSHLFLGTPADNVHDMMRKGRAKFTGAKNPRKHDRHHFAKLSELSVQRLRIVAGVLKHKDLCEIFKCSKQTISAVWRRETWEKLGDKQALC